MNSLMTLVLVAMGLQIAQVVGGHYNQSLLNLAGIWGVGIPFLVAIPYGVKGDGRWSAAAGGGFLIGLIGALVGVVLAILIGDQTWLLLTFAPLSSGVFGIFGALLGRLARRKTA